jgi:hypothetical protein
MLFVVSRCSNIALVFSSTRMQLDGRLPQRTI